jgi:Ser/Thr protein kinase RdoA (MazF antagonist)
MTMDVPPVLAAWSGVLGSPWVRVPTRVLVAGRVWEVTDQRGFRYALKRISAASGDAVRRFTDEARILAYLHQRELPVAVPVLGDNGNVYATDGGDALSGSLWALTPMLPAGEDTSEEVISASAAARYHHVGATIARMHVALVECPFAIDASLEGRGRLGPDRFLELWRHLEIALPASVLADLTACVDPWLEAMLRALDEPHVQRVHGDVHGGNILTDHGAVTGIIDLDHLPLAPRSYDLGYYLAFCVHWYIGQLDLRPPVERTVAFEAYHLLSGYASNSALTLRETDALPAMGLAVALILLDYFLTSQGIVEESWVRTAHWITEHPDTLRRT